MISKEQYRSLMNGRANLYRFLSRVYKREVDQALLDQMKQMVFPSNCAEPDLKEGYRLLKDFLLKCDEDTITDLAVDYARVFLSAGISQGNAAFPYESVYTSQQKIMMQDAWERAREIYFNHGVRNGNQETGMVEDHISIELEYMSLLCDEGSRNPEKVSLLKEQKAFLDQHLLNWTGEFCANQGKLAETAFYQGIAKMTTGYLNLDSQVVNSLMDADQAVENPVSRYASYEEVDPIFTELQKEYHIYAPKRLVKRGANHKNDLIRYGEISSVKEIVFDLKSDFSPKEVYYPITQTTMFFKEDTCTESSLDDQKGIIIFARPCDINGMKRLDRIFLENGGTGDIYYKRMRDKVKIVMMECSAGWDECFCVSMNSNQTDQYSLAVKFDEKGAYIQVKDNDFTKYFQDLAPDDFVPEFVSSNRRKAEIPRIKNHEQRKKAANLNFWNEFDEKCIGCGGCNTVCGTCSCFDTIDIIYHETCRDGERRRVWSSCMLDTYTMTAGGGRFRKTPGENMRFKTLHKVYDYNLRFGGEEHMCVGCGRCEMRCPKDISFFDTICKLSSEINRSHDEVFEEE